MAHVNDTSCCAMAELCNINEGTPKEILRDHHADIFGLNATFVVFTDIMDWRGRARWADDFMRFIHRNKFGKVTRSVSKTNLNSSNNVRVYVWAVANTKLRAYCKKEFRWSADEHDDNDDDAYPYM